MLTFLLILLVIACAIIVLFILAQNPKGGGLSTTFGGATQVVGARQTADFLEKATWYVGIGIIVVVLITNFFIPNANEGKEQNSYMQEQIEDMPATQTPQNPNADQAAGAAAQQQQQQAPAN